jgi:PAS domain S-box-containing protein
VVLPSSTTAERSVKVVLWAASVAMVAGLALSVVAAFAFATAVRLVDHAVEVQTEADGWMVALLDTTVAARSYVASADRSLREPYRSSLARERVVSARLKALVVDNPIQTRNVEAADAHAQTALDELRVLVDLTDRGHHDQALAELESGMRDRLSDFREDWKRVVAEEGRLLVARRAAASTRGMFFIMGAALLGVTAFGLLAFGWRSQVTRERLFADLARRARERLHDLSDVAASLSEARTREQVAQSVVERGMHVAGADTCALYLLDEPGTTLELVAHRGVAAAIIDKIRRISESQGNPAVFDSMRAGTTIWAENEAEYAARFPGLAQMKVEGPRAKAFWSYPLVVEGKPIGLLGMGFYEPRSFSEDDRALVGTLCQQFAQALLRAKRLEGEDEARRWFTTTLKSIGDAVIATDPEGRVTFMNGVAEELTGFGEAEARGRPLQEVFQIFSEQTRVPVENPVAKVLREGTVVGLANHTVLRSKQGREIAIDDSGAPIRSESGQLIGVVLVFRDVTHEQAERARREFLSKAGEALVASLDYQVTLASVARLAVPTIADWCGVDILEPGAQKPYQAAVAHVDPSKLEFARALREQYPPDPNARTGSPEVIRSGKSELYPEIPQALLEAAAKDAEHLRLIRELRLQSAMVVPLRGRNRILGAMSFVYAESGRRYTEEDLAFGEDFARRAALAIENSLALKQVEEARAYEHRLRAEAEVASRAKDEFLAVVSHELRTPLNAVLGWAVTLRRKTLIPETDRGLAIIERNARTQAKLIEDVLDVSRIISGKLMLNLGPTSVADAITNSIETIAPAAAAKSIVVTYTLGEEPLVITADADRVQQVVWNLLSNAVKFTPKGGSISVDAERVGSNVLIRVSDSGEGIHADALPFIFDLFHQADASTTRRHGGLGLGLAIVRQLVNAHGGSVSAESGGGGKGATFVIELPARSAVAAVERAPRALSTGERAPEGVELPRLDGLRLLIVDDEVDALSLVTEVLRETGAEVHSATSASEALEKFETVRPDVLVSDIGMPHEDGYSLIRRIRMLPAERGGRTPSVALTAYAREEDAQRAFAAGYQKHVVKPVEPGHLVNVVANLGGRILEPV